MSLFDEVLEEARRRTPIAETERVTADPDYVDPEKIKEPVKAETPADATSRYIWSTSGGLGMVATTGGSAVTGITISWVS